MQTKPLIFGADLGTLRADPNPAIRQICKAADGQPTRTSFRRAVVANLKSPRAMLSAIKSLKPAKNSTTAKNAATLARVIRGATKPMTPTERTNAQFSKNFQRN